MRQSVIYEIPSLYRENFRVHGYTFGQGERSLCVVGSLRGNEYQQIYTCSQLVKALRRAEQRGDLNPGKEILVLPSLNPYSMNVGKRFWPTDNTDINRMFPGYNLGETTQRIADGVFRQISRYDNGIQLASFYMPGRFLPHIRIMRTGFENVEKAEWFGMPHIVLRDPRPYDTTTLNYNWQIWDTNAYSLYTTTTTSIDEESADQAVRAIFRFLSREGILNQPIQGGFRSQIWEDSSLASVRPRYAGIFRPVCKPGDRVVAGDPLAEILDPGAGETMERLLAPCDGVVFFLHTDPMTYANTAVVKLLPEQG